MTAAPAYERVPFTRPQNVDGYDDDDLDPDDLGDDGEDPNEPDET